MKRFLALVETFGSLLGFAVLFGPPAWSEVNRGVTIALLVTLGISAFFGLGLLWKIALAQREPPYEQRVSKDAQILG
jgi:hypothetical protein